MGARWLLILMLSLVTALSGCAATSAAQTDAGGNGTTQQGEDQDAGTDTGDGGGQDQADDEEPVIPADPDC